MGRESEAYRQGLARLIRDYRAGCNPPLRQSELAKRLNVTQQTVSNWERAKFTPRPSMRRKLAEALGVPLSQLSQLWSDPDDRPRRIPANPYTQSGVFVHRGLGGPVAADAETANVDWGAVEEVFSPKAKVAGDVHQRDGRLAVGFAPWPVASREARSSPWLPWSAASGPTADHRPAEEAWRHPERPPTLPSVARRPDEPAVFDHGGAPL
jgi:transcriptional regulator with XRE-family HTH domain